MAEIKQSDSIVEMFLFEAEQLTEQLENILLDSETNKEISTDNINEIFRIMHTLKGSAAMMELTNISTVSHKLEDLFFYFRENPEVQIDVTAVCDIVLKGLDYVRNSLEDFQNGAVKDEDPDADELKESVINYLNKLKGKDTSAPAPKKTATKKKSTTKKTTKSKSTKTNNDDNQEANYKATVFFTEMCSMHVARAFMVVNNLSKVASNIEYYPDDLENDDKTITHIINSGFEITFYSELGYYDIKDLIEKVSEVKTAIVQSLLPTDEMPQSEEVVDEPEETSKAEVKQAEAKTETKAPVANATKAAPAAVAKPSIISVNINKLDSILDIVGEIVISESMVLNSPDLEGLELKNFSKAALQLRKLTDELQDLAISVRMVPIDMSFNKMHRIVRDMSKKLDKEARLEIIGETTEVDKNVIDSLSDPLMHLVRNCMDHGLETKEERAKTGKDPVGTVTLEAYNTGSDVIITVSDDGKGLNKEKIYQKAKENGITTKEISELTDKEIYNFILLPGFSTKEKITEFSGRGVGMDVVKKNIESVRGTISVDSKPGFGSTTTIKIPLTLAIIDGMLIGIGDTIYIIPTQSIVQTFRPETSNIFLDAEGNRMVKVRDECYPVINLSKRFNIKTDIEKYEDGVLIMIEQDERVVCVSADCLLGQQPIVVKSLPKLMSKYNLKERGIGGCTILGNGNISLIFDVTELINSFYN